MSPGEGYARGSHARKRFCETRRKVALKALLPLAAITINSIARKCCVLALCLIAR
jgi:hypothetical protein